jgi:hypothetical protein
MKRLLVVVFIALCGCGDEVNVVAADGNDYVGYCNGNAWVDCVKNACPHGFLIVKKPSYTGSGILRCNP